MREPERTGRSLIGPYQHMGVFGYPDGDFDVVTHEEEYYSPTDDRGRPAAEVDKWNNTALHWAAYRGRLDEMRRLLAAGARHDVRNELGCTPITCAVDAGQLDAVKLLLRAGARPGAGAVGRAIENLKGIRSAIAPATTSEPRAELKIRDGLDELTLQFGPGEGGTRTDLAILQMLVAFRVCVVGLLDHLASRACEQRAWDDLLVLLRPHATDLIKSHPQPMYWPVFVAALEHDLPEVLDLLLSNGADVAESAEDPIWGNSETPLGVAAKHGSVQAMELLLAAGADPNGTDRSGKSPLQVLTGPTEGLRLLLDAGAVSGGAEGHQKYRSLARLYIASNRLNFAELVLAEGLEYAPSQEARQELGVEAVCSAVETGDCMLVRWVATKVPLSSDDWGLVATLCEEVLMRPESEHLVKDLVELGLDQALIVPKREQSSRDSFWLAVSNRSTDPKLRRELLLASDPQLVRETGETPLYFAVLWDDREAVDQLLRVGASPHCHDQEGRTPLHLAIQCRGTGLVSALLRAGADPHGADQQGQVPLQLATSDRRPVKDIVVALLEAGADPNVRDRAGRVPLHYLVKPHSDFKFEALEVLVGAGAMLTVRDRRGRTPVHCALAARNARAVARLRAGKGRLRQDWRHRGGALWAMIAFCTPRHKL